MSRVLIFEHNGYVFGVPEEQVEKILINKYPERSEFTLATGVEVKSLSEYIPIEAEFPESEKPEYENIIFIKGQKDYYGFTVNRIRGYLNVKDNGESRRHERGEGGVKFFIRHEEKLVPVLDLKKITNREVVLSDEEIDEIKDFAEKTGLAGKISEEEEEDILEVSREEVYRAIEEEINKQKRDIHYDVEIISEKKGFVLPLVVNLIVIVMVTAGILYYTFVGNKEAFTVMRAGKVGGVEEAVIKEIRRRSEKEVEEQKKKLEEAKKRLQQLEKERDYFLKNQDKILAERERKLKEEFEKKLEEARKRIIASGVEDVEGAYQKEKEKLYAEFLREKEKTQREIEEAKKKFEEQLRKKEAMIRKEVEKYNRQITAMEQQIMEQKKKLKEAERAVQSIRAQQEAYLAFRKQLNILYGKALNYFSAKNYRDGIDVLKKMLPVINTAKKRGLGDSYELGVEEKLVKNLMDLAAGAESNIEYRSMIKKTYETARLLDRKGKIEDALMKYFTVYTLSNDEKMKNYSISRAKVLLDQMYNTWDRKKREELRTKALEMLANAESYKNSGDYNRAVELLNQTVAMFAGSEITRKALDELIDVNKKIKDYEEKKRLEEINNLAKDIYEKAEKSYKQGFLSEAYDGFKEILVNYRESRYAEMALKMIDRINKKIKSMKVTGKVNLLGKTENTGVVVQLVSKTILLVSLGSEDGLTEGSVLQVVRKSGNDVIFVGNIKLVEVFPNMSRGKLLLYEKTPKVGDLVVF